MYLPDLIPRDAHHLWMNQSSSRTQTPVSTGPGQLQQQQQIQQQLNNSQRQTNYAPPFSSYSPAFSGPMRSSMGPQMDNTITSSSSSSFSSSRNPGALYLSLSTSNTTTLDYLNTEMSHDLQYLKSIGKLGYSYLKPIGIEKTMKQMFDEQEIVEDPVNFEGDLAAVVEDDEDGQEEEEEEVVNDNNGGVIHSGTNIQVVNSEVHDHGTIFSYSTNSNARFPNNGAIETQEIDLDADIPDGGDFSISYDNDNDDDLEEDEGEDGNVYGNNHRGDNNDNNDDIDDNGLGDLGISIANGDEEFMAAEEYQDDHSISIDSITNVDVNTSHLYQPQQQHQHQQQQLQVMTAVGGNNNSSAVQLDSGTLTTNTGTSNSGVNFPVVTGNTSPQTPIHISSVSGSGNNNDNNNDSRDFNSIRTSGLRIEARFDDGATGSSDYDMTIE